MPIVGWVFDGWVEARGAEVADAPPNRQPTRFAMSELTLVFLADASASRRCQVSTGSRTLRTEVGLVRGRSLADFPSGSASSLKVTKQAPSSSASREPGWRLLPTPVGHRQLASHAGRPSAPHRRARRRALRRRPQSQPVSTVSRSTRRATQIRCRHGHARREPFLAEAREAFYFALA